MLANEYFVASGSSGSNSSALSRQNIGIPNENSTILFHDSYSQPLNGDGFIGSANPNSFNESSCFDVENWNQKTTINDMPHLQRERKGVMKSTQVKRQWTSEEDSRLIELVRKFGYKKWSLIASKFRKREGKQCRERWLNHLRPDIKKDRITENEEIMIVEGHKKCGSSWVNIAKQFLPGRTENAIKNHFYTSKRKVENDGYIPKTYLEEYINKTFNIQSSAGPISRTVDAGAAWGFLDEQKNYVPQSSTAAFPVLNRLVLLFRQLMQVLVQSVMIWESVWSSSWRMIQSFWHLLVGVEGLFVGLELFQLFSFSLHCLFVGSHRGKYQAGIASCVCFTVWFLFCCLAVLLTLHCIYGT